MREILAPPRLQRAAEGGVRGGDAGIGFDEISEGALVGDGGGEVAVVRSSGFSP